MKKQAYTVQLSSWPSLARKIGLPKARPSVAEFPSPHTNDENRTQPA